MSSPAQGLAVAQALAGRNLLMLRRIPTVLIPSLVFPIFLVVAFSGAYGALTQLPGFPVDNMIDWMLPMSIVQGAAFAGVAVGLGALRDLQNGFFDRLLVAPVSRLSLIAGPLVGVLVRGLIPLVVVLVAGLAAGARLRGGIAGVLVLVVAAEGAALCAGGWALGLALRFKNERAAPLMQLGIFVTVFLSTAQVPLAVMTGWLKVVARANPMTHVLALARQGFVGGVRWDDTWPGLVALAGGIALLTLFAVRGLRSFGNG